VFNEVTGVEKLPGEIILPEPESSDHEPVPGAGAVAMSVAPDVQMVWLDPALAVGGRSLVMLTAEVAVGQLPLLTVHKNKFVPVPSELTCDEALFNALMFPLPEIRDQLPVPAGGAVADSVAKVAQRV
jgi:hypothetical protein